MFIWLACWGLVMHKYTLVNWDIICLGNCLHLFSHPSQCCSFAVCTFKQTNMKLESKSRKKKLHLKIHSAKYLPWCRLQCVKSDLNIEWVPVVAVMPVGRYVIEITPGDQLILIVWHDRIYSLIFDDLQIFFGEVDRCLFICRFYWCKIHYMNWMFFSCDQAALQMVFSVRLSVCPSVRLFHHLGKRKRRIATFTIPF